MTDRPAIGRAKANIKKYINEDATLTPYAIEQWQKYFAKCEPEIPRCCANKSEYTLSLAAWFAAGAMYPNLQIRTTPIVMLYCNSCGRVFTFAGNVVFPELHETLDREGDK